MGIPGGFGSVLIGGLISAMYALLSLSLSHRLPLTSLLHIKCYTYRPTQTYVYYMHYSEDTAPMKLLVAAICVLDTLHVSLTCHALYYYLIINYGVVASLDYMVWSFQVCTPNFLQGIVLEYLPSLRYRLW
ncbi:hypothetical protein EDD17DRAFT_1572109 [Pisolithus thermaeus]|nr:hypothetical protein EDD17DRAFT_1572109 [Pisolithus thermaeus]